MQPSDNTRLIVESIKREQRTLRERMELTLLRDLVEKLDPAHNYIFDAQAMKFVKEPKVKPEELPTVPPPPSPGNGPMGLGGL